MDGAELSVHTVSSARVRERLNKTASTGTGTCTRAATPAQLVLQLVPVAYSRRWQGATASQPGKSHWGAASSCLSTSCFSMLSFASAIARERDERAQQAVRFLLLHPGLPKSQLDRRPRRYRATGRECRSLVRCMQRSRHKTIRNPCGRRIRGKKMTACGLLLVRQTCASNRPRP